MKYPAHFVAIFGGAVSGAEAAYQLSKRGINVVVFEQNILPYGKIEDGLPKWHYKLRDKEEQRINEKLDHPLVTYVPGMKLGEDIDFEQVSKDWGFSAVLLATGAWKDRNLPVDDIDEHIGERFYYQNPFIYWFNHYHEPGYSGQQFEIHDDAIVVGGGLASLDVVKILMLELTKTALEKKGHKIDILSLEMGGIARSLDELGVKFSELDIKGCTLYYRRRVIDMPLFQMSGETPEQIEKAHKVNKKIMSVFQTKYLFKFEECRMPVKKIVEGDRLAGLVFQKTKIENGKAVPIPGSETEIRTPLIISSIGSIPELINGIPAEMQVFKIKDFESCQIEGYENVFVIGNAVTGKGNINESMKHSRELSKRVMDNYLNWNEEDYQNFLRNKESTIEKNIDAISNKLKNKKMLSVEKIIELHSRIKELQQKSGYNGNFRKWIEKYLPERLENMV